MYRCTPLPVGTLLLQALVAPLHGTIANLKRAKLERVAVGGLSLADGRTDAGTSIKNGKTGDLGLNSNSMLRVIPRGLPLLRVESRGLYKRLKNECHNVFFC